MSRRTVLRSLTTLGLIVGSLVSATGLASADDLDDYLARAADAEYGGRRIIVTVWDGASHAGIVDIEHGGGVTMILDESGEMMVGEGKMTGGDTAGIAIPEWHLADDSDRYSLGEPEHVTRIGREAVGITVVEGDLVRARIFFDEETWAPLATEIFNGDGEMFRLAAFTDFDASPALMHTKMRQPEEYDVANPVEGSSLPGLLAGYTQVDVYDVGDGVQQAFYTDGLFSFSLFQTAGKIDDDDFDDAQEIVVEDDTYALIVDPAELWVSWRNGGTSFVLVGNLPPDHLESVLGQLPEPRNRGLLSRLWSDIFG